MKQMMRVGNKKIQQYRDTAIACGVAGIVLLAVGLYMAAKKVKTE